MVFCLWYRDNVVKYYVYIIYELKGHWFQFFTWVSRRWSLCSAKICPKCGRISTFRGGPLQVLNSGKPLSAMELNLALSFIFISFWSISLISIFPSFFWRTEGKWSSWTQIFNIKYWNTYFLGDNIKAKHIFMSSTWSQNCKYILNNTLMIDSEATHNCKVCFHSLKKKQQKEKLNLSLLVIIITEDSSSQSVGWGPFQGVHEVKTIFIDYNNANNIINSCLFNCGYVTVDADGTEAKVSKTAWASTWIKGVGANCTGSRCILPCHTFTVNSCQIHLRTSLMKQ